MPPKTDLIKGGLKVTGLLEELCVENLPELIKLLPTVLSIEVPSTISNVTIGVEQPSDTERSNFWVRTDNSGDFVGLYVYALGQWRQIYPVPDSFTLITGDSRTPPAGYTLATDSLALTTSQKDWLKLQQHWHNDVVNSYYDLFYVFYSGF